MTNIFINEIHKNVQIRYTKQVKNYKLFIHWDEFYIKVNPKHTITEIEHILHSHIDWMKNILKKYEKQVTHLQHKIKNENLTLEYRTKEELQHLINQYLKKYSYKGTPNRIFIKSDMNRSWASHSQNHNLSFSTKLQYVPKELVEYNVYHELCHYEEWEHTPRFYELISEVYPNYKEYDELANAYSYLLVHKQ